MKKYRKIALISIIIVRYIRKFKIEVGKKAQNKEVQKNCININNVCKFGIINL